MVGLVNVLDHVSVTVSDMERSLAFYRDLLGLKVVETHHLEGETIEKMTGKPGVVMEVVRLEAPETPGILLDLQQYVKARGGVSTAQLGGCSSLPHLLRRAGRLGYLRRLESEGCRVRVGAGQFRPLVGCRARGVLERPRWVRPGADAAPYREEVTAPLEAISRLAKEMSNAEI